MHALGARDRLGSLAGNGQGELLVVGLVRALLGRYAELAGRRRQRSPAGLVLIAPRGRIARRAPARDGRNRLNVALLRDITAVGTEQPQFPRDQPVALGGRHVGRHAAPVHDGHEEARVGAAGVQVHPVERGEDGGGRAEEPQRLVHQMAAEVAQQPARRAGLEGVRLVEVEAGLEPRHLPYRAGPQHRAERPDVRVPAAVVEHIEDHAGGRGRLDQLAAHLGVRGEGLVRHHMDAGRNRLEDQRAAGFRRRGDHHRVNAGGQQLRQGSVERYIRILRRGLRTAGGRARHDAGQFHSVRGRDERSVEEPAAKAESN
ncbi:hypothetical protein D9M72_405710 [compost metagenome]